MNFTNCIDGNMKSLYTFIITTKMVISSTLESQVATRPIFKRRDERALY